MQNFDSLAVRCLLLFKNGRVGESMNNLVVRFPDSAG